MVSYVETMESYVDSRYLRGIMRMVSYVETSNPTRIPDTYEVSS